MGWRAEGGYGSSRRWLGRYGIFLGICLGALPASGEEAGPAYLLSDIFTPKTLPVSPLYPYQPMDLGHVVLFVGEDPLNGYELWRTDGTREGTYFLRDVNPGTNSSFQEIDYSYGTRHIVWHGAAYFPARERSTGVELWRSDGTTTGTCLVKDFYPGPVGGGNWGLWVLHDSLYAGEYDPVRGTAVWKTDGTEAGTTPVLNFFPADVYPAIHGEFLELDATRDYLFFINEYSETTMALWKSDGTATGTSLITPLPLPSFSLDTALDTYGIHAATENLYFFAINDQVHGVELWRSDGTAGGTSLVNDIRPGPEGASLRNPFVYANILYFAADDGQSGVELWRSDGTTSGTWRVKDINPGPASSDPKYMFAYGENFVFNARTDAEGSELWVSDGTSSGTHLVKDIAEGTRASNPRFFTTHNGLLYFAADLPGEYRAVFQSDGTASGTILFADAENGGFA